MKLLFLFCSEANCLEEEVQEMQTSHVAFSIIQAVSSHRFS